MFFRIKLHSNKLSGIIQWRQNKSTILLFQFHSFQFTFRKFSSTVAVQQSVFSSLHRTFKVYLSIACRGSSCGRSSCTLPFFAIFIWIRTLPSGISVFNRELSSPDSFPKYFNPIRACVWFCFHVSKRTFQIATREFPLKVGSSPAAARPQFRRQKEKSDTEKFVFRVLSSGVHVRGICKRRSIVRTSRYWGQFGKFSEA